MSFIGNVEEVQLSSTDNVKNNTVETTNKKIIEDRRIGIEVEDIHKTKKNIDNFIKDNGGYYANEKLNNVKNYSLYNLDIKIPNKFESFITSIKSSYGKLLYKEITSRELTEQLIRYLNKIS